MWFLAVIAFGILNGVLGVNETCIKNLGYSCENYHAMPMDIPSTVTELEDACS
ncbi:hypothetical protein CDAR_620021, partial [Caerostris darwini]